MIRFFVKKQKKINIKSFLWGHKSQLDADIFTFKSSQGSITIGDPTKGVNVGLPEENLIGMEKLSAPPSFIICKFNRHLKLYQQRRLPCGVCHFFHIRPPKLPPAGP